MIKMVGFQARRASMFICVLLMISLTSYPWILTDRCSCPSFKKAMTKSGTNLCLCGSSQVIKHSKESHKRALASLGKCHCGCSTLDHQPSGEAVESIAALNPVSLLKQYHLCQTELVGDLEIKHHFDIISSTDSSAIFPTLIPPILRC